MQGQSIGKLHAGGAGKRERRLTYFSAQPLRFFEVFDYQSSDLEFVAKPPALLPASPRLKKKNQAL